MSDFSTVLTEDQRLQLTPAVEFAVYKGPATIAPTTFPATGAPSSTSHQYMLTVPSLENCVDRCIIWESQFTITFASVGNLPVGEYLLDLSGLDSLAPFPLSNLVTQMNCQINSTQVNINMQDILPQLLSMISREELIKWNNMTPTYIDNYARYQDAFVAINSVVTGVDPTAPATSVIGSAYVPAVNNPLGNYGSGVHPEYVPRGSWVLDNVVNPVGAGAPSISSVTVTVREPLLISPLLFACEGVALQGINQFNFQINLDSTGKRVWRSSPLDAAGNARTAYTITNISFGQSSSKMYVNFLTPSPYQLAKFNPRNVCDYYQLDRYITNTATNILAGASTSTFTSSIQLASIPDKAILCVKESYASLTNYMPDRFMTINNVSCNFNAKQNILAQATQQLLYRYSVEAGSQQTWLEFSGKACVGQNAGQQVVVGTPGSVLCLDFGKHIDIPEMYLSSGSAGQFNLQFNVTYTNNTGETLVNGQVVLIIMTSGVFSSEKGQSQVFTSLLNKDAVMSVLDEKPQTTANLKRLVGGSWLNSLMRVGKAIAPALAPLAKEGLAKMGGPVGNMGAKALGAMGYGRSGGGPSAGGLSKHFA
jgi:hypothetical protein